MKWRMHPRLYSWFGYRGASVVARVSGHSEGFTSASGYGPDEVVTGHSTLYGAKMAAERRLRGGR